MMVPGSPNKCGSGGEYGRWRSPVEVDVCVCARFCFCWSRSLVVSHASFAAEGRVSSSSPFAPYWELEVSRQAVEPTTRVDGAKLGLAPILMRVSTFDWGPLHVGLRPPAHLPAQHRPPGKTALVIQPLEWTQEGSALQSQALRWFG